MIEITLAEALGYLPRAGTDWRVLATRQPILLDLTDTLGAGGPHIYVPRSIVISREGGQGDDITITNAESVLKPGYSAFAVVTADVMQTLFLDLFDDTVKLATHPALPATAATIRPASLLEFRGAAASARSPLGLAVQDLGGMQAAGPIGMGGKRIFDLPPPILSHEPATKGSQDAAVFAETELRLQVDNEIIVRAALTATQSMTPSAPLVVQRDWNGSSLLLIARSYGYRDDYGFQVTDPATATWSDGARYASQPVLESSATVQFHTYNHVKAGEGLDPLDIIGGFDADGPGYNVSLIGKSTNGWFYGGANAVVGTRYGGVSQNVSGCSADARRANRFWAETVPVQINNPVLNGLGVAFGFRNTTSALAAVGGAVPAAAQVGACFMARVFVMILDGDDEGVYTAADFGSPKVFYFSGGTLIDGAVMTLERRHGPRLASFTFAARWLFSSPFEEWLIGVDATGSGHTLAAAGAQIAFSDQPVAWMDWMDHGGAVKALGEVVSADIQPDVVMPNRIWVWEGQDTALFLQNTLPDQPDGASIRAAVTAKSEHAGAAPITASGTGELRFTASAAGYYGGEVLVRRLHAREQVWASPLEIIAVSPTGLGSPKVLLGGDSLANRYVGEAVRDILVARGFTPEMVGTVEQFRRGAAPVMGECREGRGFLHYITYFPPSFDGGTLYNMCKPIPDDEEAFEDYEALGSIEKMFFNPFAKTVAPGTPNSHNGQQIDFQFYADRSGIEQIDMAIWCLGENDRALGSSGTISIGLEDFYARWRAYSAVKPIAFFNLAVAKAGSVTGRWAQNHAEIIRVIQAFVRAKQALGDDNIDFIDTYVRMNPDSGWHIAADGIDAMTGLIRGRIDNVGEDTSANGHTYARGGDVHPADVNVQALANGLAAYIAGKMA